MNFKKQATEQNAAQALQDADVTMFTDEKKRAQFAQQLLQGEQCAMTCHMVEVENDLGRSLVIDLTTDKENKFRQIDHRTIDSIIFKNVKYTVKKSGGRSFADIDTRIGKDEAKWDASQLKVGDMFSGTSYYETVTDMGDSNQVFCYEKSFNDRGVMVDKRILNEEMTNGSLYQEEQKLSMTDLATKLTAANNMCFQVCFTKKPDARKVAEQLSEIKKAPSAAAARDLAKKCLVGDESTLICHLTKAEGKLGRSLVIDLPTGGFRQVDHRTLKWIVIDNVKYVLRH